IFHDAQGDRGIAAPHGHAQRRADAGQHDERGDDGPQHVAWQPCNPCGRSDTQARRGEVERSLGEVEAGGIEEVRHREQRNPDPAKGWRATARATAYAPPTSTQLARKSTRRRRSGRPRPSSHAHTIRAGATAAFSLERRPRPSAAALHPTLWRTTPAYTASTANSAAMSSARPTTFATASTCTGCTANSNPATSATASSAQRRARAATATATPACHSRLTAWNQTVPSTSASRANPVITSGRYM